MIIWYIKEETKEKRLMNFINKVFNIIETNTINNRNFCILPTYGKKIKKRTINKLNKILYINDVQNVVLSNKLSINLELMNKLYSNNINILDGKQLYSYLEPNVIEYILKKRNKKINDSEITILVNDSNDINLNNIKEISKRMKRINIVTNHINRFKSIEQNLLDNYGIMIRITNNYKQALIRAKIILNMDFPQELLSKYMIYRKAVIISLKNKLENMPKKFDGIIISDIDMKIPEEYKEEGFKDEIVYESNILNLKDYNIIKNKIKEDNLKIIKIIGINGVINNNELLKNT